MTKSMHWGMSCLVAAGAASLWAQAASPTPAELIARAISAKKAQAQRDRKYTYREEHEETQLDKNGNPGSRSSKTYDHIMLEGAEYKKLILIDGKPLDAKTQKKVDEDLEKARAERRKGGVFSFHRTVSLGGLDLFERLFDNKVTGEETVRERKTWRMESEPKSGYKAANKQEKEALASRRVTWFDQEDGAVVKESSLFVRAVNGFQPGSVIDLEFRRIGDDWVVEHAAMRADMKMIPGFHGRVESHQRYSDYRRFSVDSTVTPE